MWPSVLYFTTIFFGSVLTTAATVWIGHRNDWLVYPRSDRWSRALVVKFGGVSILLTFLLPLSVVVPSWPLRTVALLTAAMGLVGLVDDIFELLPSRKFASQFIVAAVAVWSGVPQGTAKVRGITLTT